MAASDMIKPNTVIMIAFFAFIGFSPFMGPFTSPIRFSTTRVKKIFHGCLYPLHVLY
jgi:hypothetical protein